MEHKSHSGTSGPALPRSFVPSTCRSLVPEYRYTNVGVERELRHMMYDGDGKADGGMLIMLD